MTTVVLIRHGRSTANADGVLAGRAEGVELDDVGREQATGLKELLAGASVTAAYRSPSLRCQQTATLLGLPDAEELPGLDECDYGAWTNRKLMELAAEPLWSTIQQSPSAVVFPDGESMEEMRARAVDAIATIRGRHEKGETVVVVSHGDVIKAILSDALAQGFDDFQRLNVAPASVSIVNYSSERPFVVCINANSDVSGLLAVPAAPVVGGGDVAHKE
ncbi:MSMEG_4193 family putative phosphomutase [Tessaracoccus antarcticus]|uniref:MSMEG_4193 family putative phosphomutase n=1 Tax=Tessaracoccus antarcticus TaxID=2479848 RepID=A0A3M0G0P5_9ACTN|nr:MSMEG_4193 family putative phosphomutase [Tessaracoccus antarcticus]RMB57757.1 MSMEG_4193 family putative phosphomutase [Tessaracoccus antarcticus]